MDKEAQRLAIAEACGWKWGKHEWSEEHWQRPDGIAEQILPDYLNDLNAMHEAVAPYLYEEAFWKVWTGHLKTMDKECEGWNTTAAQRAEAFLKTIGKWQDDKTPPPPLTEEREKQ